jgi:hypothetical protein
MIACHSPYNIEIINENVATWNLIISSGDYVTGEPHILILMNLKQNRWYRYGKEPKRERERERERFQIR